MFLSRLFGGRRKIRQIRKRWDRQREKTLKTNEPLKSALLKKLDGIELNIRIMEEQRLNGIQFARMAKEAEIDLAETRAMLDSKGTYLSKGEPVGMKQ